jgi:hypothetical protein
VLSPFVRTFALDDGPRVRLRLARRSDAAAVRELLERRGVEASALDVLRLLAFDPAERLVLCAFMPIDRAETLVGLGAIDLFEDADPDTLVADEDLAPGLGALLGDVLEGRARAHGRRVA